MTDARAELNEVTRIFFAAFTNRGRAQPQVDALYRLFLPQAVITKRHGASAEVYDLAGFIEPRRKLLTEGSLLDFSEQEVSARTEIFGGIAQRFCTYRKAGVLNGQPFAGGGVKTIQFVQLNGTWRISALAWEDERPGLPVPGNAGLSPAAAL